MGKIGSKFISFDKAGMNNALDKIIHSKNNPSFSPYFQLGYVIEFPVGIEHNEKLSFADDWEAIINLDEEITISKGVRLR